MKPYTCASLQPEFSSFSMVRANQLFAKHHGLRASKIVAFLGKACCCVQAAWRNLKPAVKQYPGAEDASIQDMRIMAELCLGVVVVRDPMK